jgi:lysophospholipase L1-like esterase
MSRAGRRAGALLAALAAVAVWFAPSAAAECPDPVWGCPDLGYAAHRGRATRGEHVTVVGDSLVQGLGPRLADRLSDAGFVSFTIGASGYAYRHWNAGRAQRLDIGDYVARERADHVVLALGTNDARVLASRPGAVTAADVAAQVAHGAGQAVAASRGCVILVLPTTRGHPAEAAAVRGLLTRLAAGSPRFAVADWGAWSAGHEGWFRGPRDVHFTAAGDVAYAAFLTGYAVRARAGSLGC